jgi:hypothetical protein
MIVTTVAVAITGSVNFKVGDGIREIQGWSPTQRIYQHVTEPVFLTNFVGCAGT